MSLDSHQIAQILCQPGVRVLDVGCGPGVVAQLFSDIGCDVVGIDIDQSAVEAMIAAGRSAFRADLDHDDLGSILGEQAFDVIVCLDVLEHTKNPEAVLTSLLAHLEDDGDVIISLPNVTHGDVRLSLLGGEFTYRDEGLLDATHLRFFDRSAVDELVGACGLEMRELQPVIMGIGQTELGVDTSAVDPDLLAQLEQQDESTIYQWVFRANRSAAVASSLPFVGLLDEMNMEVVARRGAEDYVRTLEVQIAEFGTEQAIVKDHVLALENEIRRRDVYVAELEQRVGAAETEREAAETNTVEAKRAAVEDLEFLNKELAANRDIVDLISDENNHVHAEVQRLGAELAQVSGELSAVTSRRSYRLINRLARLPGFRALAR